MTNQTRSQSEEEIETIGLVIQDQSVTSHLKEIVEATATDNVLQSVINLISENWPISKRRLPTKVLPFWSIKDQLSFHDGIIYKGDRIVVPATLRKSLTEKLHQAHMGVESTLVARYELSTETLHIFMSSLSILSEKQPERNSDESFYS